MEGNERIKDIYHDYSWYLTLKKMCNGPEDLERVGKLQFSVVLNWLELAKAEQEIEYIEMESSKNKFDTK
jgi:hypothetical protein